MFGLSKIANYILTTAIAILLAVFLSLTALSFSGRQILTDRENPKRWLKEESLREQFVAILADQVYSEKPAEVLAPVISKADFTKIATDETNKEWVDQAIDLTVDNTYNWLEGKSEAPEIVIPVKKDQENGIPSLETLITEKIGKPAELIDFEKVNELSPAIKLLNTEKITIMDISDGYEKFKKLPEKLLVVTLVIGGILLISASSLRHGVLMIGTGLIVSSGLLLFGPSFLHEHPEITKDLLSMDLTTLPKLIELPEIIRDLFNTAFKEIYANSTLYAIVAGVIGIIATVISQLNIKSVELEPEIKPTKDFF